MNLALALLVGVPLLAVVAVISIIYFHAPTTYKFIHYMDQFLLSYYKEVLSAVKINKQTMAEIKAMYPTVSAGIYYKLKERYAAIERRNDASIRYVIALAKFNDYQERTINADGFGDNINVLVHPNHIDTFDSGDYLSIKDYILVIE